MSVYGYIGGGFVSITLVPQIIHTIRLKRVEQLSSIFLITNTIGTVFMLIYSIQESLVPVFITNTFIFVCNITLCGLYIIYRRRSAEVQSEVT